MLYNYIKQPFSLFLITVLSNSTFGMEKIPAAAQPLTPHKEELMHIKCDLMAAIEAGIQGEDSSNKFSEADLDEELKQSTPRKFKEGARQYFYKKFQARCAAKGVTPDQVESLREAVKEDIDLDAMADEGHSPASTPTKEQVRKVADRINHRGLDVRKTKNGNTAYTRGGMLVIDESVVREVAPTTPLKEALWAHELTHDKEQDLVTRLAYERAFEQQGQPMTPTSKRCLERFHEIFADIQEASTPQSAQAVHTLTSRNAKVAYQEHAGMHPKSDDRVSIARLNRDLVYAERRRKIRVTTRDAETNDAPCAPVSSRRNLLDIFNKENDQQANT